MAINRKPAAPTFVSGGMFSPSSFGALYESMYISEKEAIEKDDDDDDEASEGEVNRAFKKHLKSKHKKSSCGDKEKEEEEEEEDDDDDKKEVKEDYDVLSYLYDYELNEIVDETIESMYEECYDLDEIESAFDEFLEEATVTMGRGGYTSLSSDERGRTNRSRVTSGRGTDLRKQAKRDAIVSAARQRQAQAVKDAPGKAVSRVKDAVKGGVDRARKTVDSAAGDYAAKHKVMTSKKGQALNRSAIGMKQYGKDPAGRRSVRSAVVGHLVGRAKNKISKGVDAVRAKASDVVSKVKSSSEKAQTSARKAGKGFIGRAARRVASGAGNLASRLGEDYDVVVEYLLDEGYVDNIVSAEVFANHISEEWVESILEEVYE